MSRVLLVPMVLALSLSARAAHAGESAAAAPFREMVTRWAGEDQRYVEQWWEANLDADPKLERVAVVCDTSGDDKKGYFIVEKDAQHRWEIAFDVDAHTDACKGAPAAPPPFAVRTTPTIDLKQSRRTGWTITSYALRVGQPVVVREQSLDETSESKKPVVTDWDLLIKKRKEKNYSLPEHMTLVNRP